MPLMSLKEYAAHRGVSPAAISLAVKNGRCPATLDPMGRKVIDSEKADAEWINTGRGPPPGVKQGPKLVDAPIDTSETKIGGAPTLLASRQIREAYQARMAKLDYDERTGKTIESEEVKEQSFKAARIVRDNMLNIPDRLAAELAGETNQFTIHKKLTDEIKKAIQDAISTIRNQEIPSE